MSMTRREALRSLLAATGGLTLGPSELVGSQEPRDDSRLGPTGPSSAGGFVHPPIQTPSLQPFGIDFSEAAVADLHRRIDRFRWPEMPFDTGWSAGTDGEVLRELVDHWRNDYDWFAVQDRLNELTHLKGPVEGEGLHCVVYRSGGGIGDAGDDTGRIGGAVGAGGGAGAAEAGDSFPLLLLHGWPGSFHEFHEAAPRLAAGIGGTQGFDVVVPSLPGFVLSDPPTERGMDPTRIAERLHALMGELGYGRYGVQGGDWGGIIGTQMARLFPDALVGLHLNFVASAPPPPEGVEPSPEEVAYREARARFSDAETGYSAIQGTKPRTLAYAQQDSPVGWLAWMLEKYWAWSDHGEDLWDTFSRDDVLTTAMLYWMPGRILSAARIYYETSNPVSDRRVGGRVEVPTGYARFPAEPWAPPVEVVERTYNVVRYTEPDRGGHFPALEQPEIWSEDVGRFFSEVRG